MAKKKLNERRTYDLGSKDVITYKKSRIPRQMQFMILRGPGLNAQEAIDENAMLKKLALRKQIKLKFMQAMSVEDIISHLKDANTWASGVVMNIGNLTDENLEIKKIIKKILIPVLEVKEDGKSGTILDGFAKISNS